MKKSTTIKWRIYKSNLIGIVLLITLVTVIFNIAIRFYIEKDILGQLKRIGEHTQEIALKKGPDFFGGKAVPPSQKKREENDMIHYYFILDRSLRETLSVLNAHYILLDQNKQVINPFPEEYIKTSEDLLLTVTDQINTSINPEIETYLNFKLEKTRYIAVIKPVSDKNNFGLGWIVIYSSLEKVNQLHWMINGILLSILLVSALIIAVFSSLAAKKISEPFSTLNHHIKLVAERNFGKTLQIPVDDELQEFVNTINLMSEKLRTYDLAQKTFLQNGSHEFRTPLMSIQSYAEGIIYDVVEPKIAAQIILEETKRMTNMVEDLLYLSRLEAIEEHDHYETILFSDFILESMARMEGIALKEGISLINHNLVMEKLTVLIDVEMLSRAVTNVIGNCIRYAHSTVSITSEVVGTFILLVIADDGPGFDEINIENVFERFYKGKKGHFGLGLAIGKNIVEKHGGMIKAENTVSGAAFIMELPILLS